MLLSKNFTMVYIMALNSEEIKNFIIEAIPDSTVIIKNISGDGNHYAVEVSSKSFAGLSRVQQHKIVYDSLKGNMANNLHALSITTKILINFS